jgi:predicted amidohydrolase YtcJ
VLPGFIEPHMHFALMAGMGHWPDVGPFRYETTAEALVALKAIAADTPPGEWVAARQFDPSLQEGPAMLTTRELDKVASDRPVFVLNASGHLAYGNSSSAASMRTHRIRRAASSSAMPTARRMARCRRLLTCPC